MVMEKWLGLEASSPFSGTIQHMQKLMRDPVFEPDNPNKLRSVLGTFAMANPVVIKKMAVGISLLQNRLPNWTTVIRRLLLGLPGADAFCLQSLAQKMMRKSVAWLSELQLSDNLQEIVAKA